MTRSEAATAPDCNTTPAAIIDVGVALTLLEHCVHAPRQWPSRGRLVQCSLARLDAGGDVLGQLPIVGDLSGAPVPWDDVSPGGVRVTMGALFALRAADRADRAGLSWERALFAAGRAVHRYLDLVPASARERLLEQYGLVPWLVYRDVGIPFEVPR